MPEAQASSLPERVADSASPSSPPRSNNSLGIQDLPTELLIDIFTEIDLLEAWPTSCRGRALPKLMAVCLQWQRICISNPQLWRYIDAIEPVSHVALLLKRSSGCTIDVRIFYREVSKNKSVDVEAVDLVLSHAARFRSLYVNVFVRDLNMFIIPWLASGPGFPALESLTIIPMEHTHLNVMRILDCGLSRVNQPRLHTLVLKQVHVPPPGQFWRSLRVLKLHDHPSVLSDPVLPFNIKDFVAVLRYNAALEELYLWCSQRRVRPEDSALVVADAPPLTYHYRVRQRTLVGLPKLQVFSIHARHALITELLLHVILSEDIPCIDIRASVPPSLIPGRPFTDLLPTHLHFLIRCMEEGVSYRYRHPYSTEFRAPPDAPADVDLAREFTSIVISVEPQPGAPPVETEPPGLDYLVEALGWMAVRRLVLSFDIAYAPIPEKLSAYEHFLDAFPALEQLELRGPIANRLDMFVALGQSGHEDAPHVEEPRCPHLRVLDVRARCYVATEVRQVLEAIFQCARVRAERRVPLDQLVLKIWVRPLRGREESEEEPDSDDLQTVTDEMVSQIRGYVGRVECTLLV